MDKDLLLLLIGAGIALASSTVTSLLQHTLSLKADRVKRGREREEKETEALRQKLTEGVSQIPKELKPTQPSLTGLKAVFRPIGDFVASLPDPSVESSLPIEKLLTEIHGDTTDLSSLITNIIEDYAEKHPRITNNTILTTLGAVVSSYGAYAVYTERKAQQANEGVSNHNLDN